MRRCNWLAAVVLALVGVSAGTGFAQNHYIMLSRSAEDPQAVGIPPTLDRELMRQALLMAARDGLGLFTRDEVLGETLPADVAPANRVVLQINAGANASQLTLSFTGNGQSPADLVLSVPGLPQAQAAGGFAADLPKLAVKAESLSRTTFAQWLKSAGFTGSTPATGVDSPLPDDMEERLSEMTIFGQFDAVRKAHQAITQRGVTVELLGALARGYANLGQLTRFHWTTTSDVFTARSLLYAQRMYDADPDLALSHWTRAYCLAMAGLQGAALKDLDAAKDADHPPEWVGMVDAMCHYDTPKLLDLSASTEKRYQVLSVFMAFLTVENSDCQGLTYRVGKFVRESTPFCDRVSDGVCNALWSGDLEGVTSGPFNSNLDLFHQELPRIADLPRRVSDAWSAVQSNTDANAGKALVSQAFVDATEPAEPSWRALGNMLQETNFLQVFRRAYYVVYYDRQDPADEIQQMSSLTRGHPFALMIDGLGDLFRNQPIPGELKNAPIQDATFRWPWPMNPWNVLSRIRSDYGNFQRIQIAHANDTAWDYERTMLADNYQITNAPLPHARRMADISPFSPVAAAVLIHNPGPQPDLDRYIANISGQFPNRPMVNSAAADFYIDRHEYAKAVPLLQSYLLQSPDFWGYTRLANCYLILKDEDDWLATVNGALNIEDFGTYHAQTENAIARHYIVQLDYNKALPHAQAAADSGPGWTQLCLADYESGLGDWVNAESLIQIQGQQYGDKINPYLWSRTSGHGDLNSAREILAAFVKANPTSYADVFYYHGENDFDNELRAAQAIFDSDRTGLTTGIWLAILHNQSGDNADAKQILTSLKTVRVNYLSAPPWKLFDQWLLEQLAPEENHAGVNPLQLQDVLDAAQAVGDENLAQIECYADYYMLHNGEEENGIKLLKSAALRSSFWFPAGFIARCELIRRGIDPYHPTAPATQPAP